MINKWDIKYIIRRVFVAIVITFVLSMLGACNAKAVNIEYIQKPTSTSGGNLNIESITGISYSKRIKNANGSNVTLFSGFGEGDIVFSILFWNVGTRTSYLKSIELFNNSNSISSVCDIGNQYSYIDNLQLNTLITAKCHVDIPSGVGITNIVLTRNYIDGELQFSTGDTMEFVPTQRMNVNVNQQQVVDAISNSQTQTIQTITNASNQAHIDAQQQHQDLQDINNSLNSDSAPSSNDISGNTDSWNSKNISNNTITQLLTMPLTLINAYLSGINGTCSSFNLGSLYGTDLVLPCINVANFIGSALWSTIDILFSGFMIFNIGRKLIKIFNDFTNLNSNQVDELYGGGA